MPDARVTRDTLRKRDGDYCPGCGVCFEDKPPTIDHKVPKSRGGLSKLANLWLLCADCNKDKADLTVEEWQEWRKGLGPKCCPHKRTRHSLHIMPSTTRRQWGRCWVEDCACKRYTRPTVSALIYSARSEKISIIKEQVGYEDKRSRANAKVAT